MHIDFAFIHIHISSVVFWSGLTMAAIIRGLFWVAKNAERLITTHADHILRQHVLHGHKQKAGYCAEDRCGELATIASIDSMTI